VPRFAVVCGMTSVRSIVCPFQNAVPSCVRAWALAWRTHILAALTMVVRRPWVSLVSAGFLNEDETPRYSDVAPEPWMYHWYGGIWFDHDHLSNDAVEKVESNRPDQTMVPARADATKRASEASADLTMAGGMVDERSGQRRAVA
jgi:hypothetical protein